MPTKFKRAARKAKNTKDAKGKVVLAIHLADSSKSGHNYPTKGNIFRTLVLEDTTVSEVLKAVEEALL